MTRRVARAAAALLMLFALPASAATISFETVYSFVPDRGCCQREDVSVSAFDPALGTLRAATFTLNVLAENSQFGAPGDVISAFVDVGVLLRAEPPFVDVFVDVFAETTAAIPQGSGSIGIAADGSGAAAVVPVDFPTLIGASPVDLIVEGFGVARAVSGTVRVDYAFAPVPLPASGVLLGLGVLGFAALRRRARA